MDQGPISQAQTIRIGLAGALVTVVLIGILFFLIHQIVVNPVRKVVQVSSQIASGDFTFEVNTQRRDELGDVFRAITAVKTSIQHMRHEAQALSQAAIAGQLDTRADLSQHHGAYREVIAGVNATLDALIEPLKVAANSVEDIARGELPPLLTEDYQGDFNTLKNNLNHCINAIHQLIQGGTILSQAAQEGRLSVRAEAAQLQGDYQRIIVGFNHTLDAIATPLEAIRIIMMALSEGDLTRKVEGHYAGDLHVLQSAVNSSLDQLNQLISAITESATAIRNAVSEITAGNMDLSQRTEEQASGLSETASQLDQLTDQVRHNAESAQKADQLAHAAYNEATQGSAIAKQAISSMQNIESSTHTMSDIITVIDGIAFQTNILALNAAVEAARAGEAGRGFAIVAKEVRNLAQRSATAAKEIKQLIESNLTMISEGSQRVNTAGESMQAILNQVQHVSQLIAEIANASGEQSASIEQVSLVVSQMDTMTQQNAALVEQATAATESLEEQTEELLRAAQAFRVARTRPLLLAAN